MRTWLDRLVPIAFAVAVLTTSAISFYEYRSATALFEASFQATRSREISDTINEVLLQVATAESSSRGYLMSRSDTFMGDFAAASANLELLFGELASLLADDPPQKTLCDRLRSLVIEKDEFHRKKIELMKNGEVDAAMRLFQSGTGSRLMEEIQKVAATMKARERDLLEERERMARADAQRSMRDHSLGTLVSVLILIAVFFYLNKEVNRRRQSEARQLQLSRLYQVLSRVSDAVVRCRDRNQLFQDVCRIAVEHGSFQMAWVGMLDFKSGTIAAVAHWGDGSGYLQAIRVSACGGPESEGPTGMAVREGTHQVFNDLGSEPRFEPWREEADAREYRSSISLPLTLKGTPIGALNVYSSQAGFFDEEAVKLLDEVASSLSFALDTLQQEEERRKAKEVLVRQAQILEQVHDSVVVTDMAGYVTSWNRGAERLFGYTPQEAVGRNISFVYPEELQRFLQTDVIEPLQQLGSHEVEVRMKRRDNRDFYAHLSLSLLADASGQPVGMIGYSMDITQRKEAEEEVRRLNQDLELRVEERTAELAAVNAELEVRNREVERANRLKSEFLASMSHELRTPLNAIVGFSDLLAEEGAGPLQEKYRRFVRHIREGSKHLLQLINDILDVSKIEADRIALEPETFSAGEAAAEVLSVLKPLSVSKQVQVSNRLGEGLEVYADRMRFKQILYNLLSNAVKFTPEGGRVEIDGSSDSTRTTFTVSDTGIGIPNNELEAIFEKFHQVGTTTRGVKEGSGLGLAITRRLIDLHGGSIWVESDPGQGSRFHFALPNSAWSHLTPHRAADA